MQATAHGRGFRTHTGGGAGLHLRGWPGNDGEVMNAHGALMCCGQSSIPLIGCRQKSLISCQLVVEFTLLSA
jgi:hypothetical protein